MKKFKISFVSVFIIMNLGFVSSGFTSAKTKKNQRSVAGESTLRLSLMECEYLPPNVSNNSTKKKKKSKSENSKRTLLIERQVRKLDQGVSDVYFVYVNEGQRRLKQFEIPETLMTYDAEDGRLKCSLRNQMNAAHVEEIDFDLAIEKATFRYQNGQTYDEVNTQGTVQPKCRELRLADSQGKLNRFLEQVTAESGAE